METAAAWLLNLVHFFWPVRYPGETDESITWRRWHTTFDWIVCIGLVFFVTMSTGHLRPTFDGFATASAQDQTASDVADILDDALRTRADKLKTEICRAQRDKDVADIGKNAVIIDRDPRELQDVEARWRKRHNWMAYPFELGCDEIVL